MKRKSYLFLLVMVLIAMFASACGAVPTVATEPPVGVSKPLTSMVEFTGVIEAINGNQWTVNGQTITVEPAVLSDANWKVGDAVKIEAEVQADGQVMVTRVKSPDDSAADNSNDDNSNDDGNDNSDDNSNGNSNDDNSNDDDGNNSNSDDDSQNSNDDDNNDNGDDNGNDDNDNDDDNGNDDDDSDDGDDDDDSNDNG